MCFEPDNKNNTNFDTVVSIKRANFDEMKFFLEYLSS